MFHLFVKGSSIVRRSGSIHVLLQHSHPHIDWTWTIAESFLVRVTIPCGVLFRCCLMRSKVDKEPALNNQ
jgi:hypothetical protein